MRGIFSQIAQISQMLRGGMAQEFSVVFGVRGGTEVGPYIKTSHARNHRAASVKSVQSVRKYHAWNRCVLFHRAAICSNMLFCLKPQRAARCPFCCSV